MECKSTKTSCKNIDKYVDIKIIQCARRKN